MLSLLSAARRRLALQDADAGITLVELLVSMIIATILGAFAVTWFISTSAATTTTTNADLITATARTPLQSFGKVLQLAGSATTPGASSDRVVALSSDSITFNAYLNNSDCADGTCADFAATLVTLSLDPTTGTLTEQHAGGPTVSTTFNKSAGAKVTVTPAGAGGCLFTAQNAAGNSVGCTTPIGTPGVDEYRSNPPLPLADQATLNSIASVQVAFTVTDSSGRAHGFQTSAAFTSDDGGGDS